MAKIKEYIWVFPLLGAIVAFISLLAPAASMNFLGLLRADLWLWDMYINNSSGITRIDFITDPFVLIPSMITTVLITFSSILLLMSGILLKRRTFELKTIRNISIISGTLILFAEILWLIMVPMFFDTNLVGHYAKLRGYENMFYDMFDNPGWVHKIMDFFTRCSLKVIKEAEKNNYLGLNNADDFIHTGSLGWSNELPADNYNGKVRLKDLWGSSEGQDLNGVSASMLDEFFIPYQIRLLEKFGLNYYGCCEDLTDKIDILRAIPNLRRIAVTPFADAARCAEQIGQDYVLSYRPSPADMVSYGFDRDRVRSILSRDLTASRDSHVDITLKDVETVETDTSRIRNWVSVTREVIDEIFG